MFEIFGGAAKSTRRAPRHPRSLAHTSVSSPLVCALAKAASAFQLSLAVCLAYRQVQGLNLLVNFARRLAQVPGLHQNASGSDCKA